VKRAEGAVADITEEWDLIGAGGNEFEIHDQT
jgi:hypothetical protein